MAEAIELNFPNENDKSSKELNTLVEDTARELAKEIDKKPPKMIFQNIKLTITTMAILLVQMF